VAKPELLEPIKRAWYEFEFCPFTEKAARLAVLNKLLDEARAGTNLSRYTLQQAIAPQYEEFRRAKRLAEAKLPQRIIGSKP